MRLIKMLGLGAVAAMAAMAFVGASSASAALTQLCNTHGALTCGSAATTIGMVNSGPVVLLGRVWAAEISIICDDIEVAATPLALANPQSVHVTSLEFTECGIDFDTNCEITVTELPLSNLNKTGLDTGVLVFTSGKMFLTCEVEEIFGDMECEYDLTGIEFSVGAQHLTTSETPLAIAIISGDYLCPPEMFPDGLLVTTANRYVLA